MAARLVRLTRRRAASDVRRMSAATENVMSQNNPNQNQNPGQQQGQGQGQGGRDAGQQQGGQREGQQGNDRDRQGQPGGAGEEE